MDLTFLFQADRNIRIRLFISEHRRQSAGWSRLRQTTESEKSSGRRTSYGQRCTVPVYQREVTGIYWCRWSCYLRWYIKAVNLISNSTVKTGLKVKCAVWIETKDHRRAGRYRQHAGMWSVWKPELYYQTEWMIWLFYDSALPVCEPEKQAMTDSIVWINRSRCDLLWSAAAQSPTPR